ncbi:MAG: hypothetical protein ACPGXI_17185, partial [Mycobacterium sp.]
MRYVRYLGGAGALAVALGVAGVATNPAISSAESSDSSSAGTPSQSSDAGSSSAADGSSTDEASGPSDDGAPQESDGASPESAGSGLTATTPAGGDDEMVDQIPDEVDADDELVDEVSDGFEADDEVVGQEPDEVEVDDQVPDEVEADETYDITAFDSPDEATSSDALASEAVAAARRDSGNRRGRGAELSTVADPDAVAHEAVDQVPVTADPGVWSAPISVEPAL